MLEIERFSTNEVAEKCFYMFLNIGSKVSEIGSETKIIFTYYGSTIRKKNNGTNYFWIILIIHSTPVNPGGKYGGGGGDWVGSVN